MKVAVVTGANRGLGLEICRQLADTNYHVILTARRAEEGQIAAKKLGVEFRQLDVSDPASIQQFAEKLREKHGRVDLLVNNAGVSLSGFDDAVVKKTLAVNFYGAMRVTDALADMLTDDSHVIMMTSEMGELACLGLELADKFSDDTLTKDGVVDLMRKFAEDVAFEHHLMKGWPANAYRVSKVGLNALVRVYDRMWQDDPRDIHVNAVDPGWVRTDMGGSSAPRSLRDGADSVMWLSRHHGDEAPRGALIRDRTPAKW